MGAPVDAASLRYWHYRKNWQCTLCIDSTLLYKYRLHSLPQPCKWWLLRFINCFVNYLLLEHFVRPLFFLPDLLLIPEVSYILESLNVYTNHNLLTALLFFLSYTANPIFFYTYYNYAFCHSCFLYSACNIS